jgi:DNA-directed RNA polymerase subunit E'/Rpb7
MLLNVTESIIVPSAWLDWQLKQHILTDLKKRKKYTYSKINGYIKDVVSLEKIHNAYVAFADSSNRFTIEYVVDILKLEKGVKCKGKIIGIYEQGVFINADGFRALVLVDKRYLDVKKKEVNLPCCPVMKLGDTIETEIEDIEFRGNHLSSCIAVHKH